MKLKGLKKKFPSGNQTIIHDNCYYDLLAADHAEKKRRSMHNFTSIKSAYFFFRQHLSINE